MIGCLIWNEVLIGILELHLPTSGIHWQYTRWIPRVEQIQFHGSLFARTLLIALVADIVRNQTSSQV